MRAIFILIAVTLASAIQVPAGAEEPSYLGAWKFVSAVPAPWAPSSQKVEEAEMKQLIGKTVTFGPKANHGPKGVCLQGATLQGVGLFGRHAV